MQKPCYALLPLAQRVRIRTQKERPLEDSQWQNQNFQLSDVEFNGEARKIVSFFGY
jgi:hypothetical protein